MKKRQACPVCGAAMASVGLHVQWHREHDGIDWQRRYEDAAMRELRRVSGDAPATPDGQKSEKRPPSAG